MAASPATRSNGTVRWNTTTASEGAHTLIVYARTAHGRRSARVLPIVVANAATFPQALTRNWLTHRIAPVDE